MREIVADTVTVLEPMSQTVTEQLMAAMALFMAADSDAEAVAEIDRDLRRAA